MTRDYWVYEKSELAESDSLKDISQPQNLRAEESQLAEIRPEEDLAAYSTSDSSRHSPEDLDSIPEEEVTAHELSSRQVLTLECRELEEISERVGDIITPPNLEDGYEIYEQRAQEIMKLAFKKILDSKISDTEGEVTMEDMLKNEELGGNNEPFYDNGITKEGDAEYMIPSQDKELIIEEVKQEAIDLANTEVAKTASSQTVKLSEPEIEKSYAEQQADIAFTEAFAPRPGDKLRQSTRDTIRNKTQNLALSGEGYWSIPQDDDFVPGDRDKIVSALFEGFEKLNDKIFAGIKDNERATLSQKLEPVGSSKDFGESLTQVIKQELTNAEVSLGLRKEMRQGESNPQIIELPNYQEENLGKSVFRLAAASIFKRVESAMEALNIKLPEAPQRKPVKESAATSTETGLSPALNAQLKKITNNERLAKKIEVVEVNPEAAPEAQIKTTAEEPVAAEPVLPETPVKEEPISAEPASLIHREENPTEGESLQSAEEKLFKLPLADFMNEIFKMVREGR